MAIWDEKGLLKFTPEIREFIEIKYTPEKLKPRELEWLSSEDLETALHIVEAIEIYRLKLKNKIDEDTIRNGFLGRDTKMFDSKKWEELLLSPEVMTNIANNTNLHCTLIWELIIKELHPDQPFKDNMILIYERELEQRSISKQSIMARKEGLKKCPIQADKLEAERVWIEWKVDQDPHISYKTNEDFSSKMVELFPNLTSIAVIKGWCSLWAKKHNVKIKKGRKKNR